MADVLLVDHHCHGLVEQDLDRAGFEALMNEGAGSGPLGTTYFESMLGLAIRRWSAPVLDLEPHVEAEDYLRRRRDLGAAEVNRRFLSSSGLSDLVVDGGFDPDRVTGPEQTASYAGARAHEVVRLEQLGQQVLADGVAPAGFADEVRERIASGPFVGAKSIAAYRVGLALPPARPGDDRLVGALRSAADPNRLADPVISGWLAHSAIEAGLPLQFHVGYGDSDVDLADCDPLALTPFLRATQDRGVPVLLLHNYPFHRHAGYLAQVFDHVFMDVGLATHNTGALSTRLVAESLELVPFAKMLFSSDAFGLAELYHLGALLFRRALDAVLQPLLEGGEIEPADADRITRLIGADNARRAYGLT